MKHVLIVAAAATLAACAPSPERIGTVNVDHDVYRTMSCADLKMRHGLNDTMMTEYIAAQNRAYVADRLTYSVLRMPLATYIGTNREYEIGRLWGERYALMVVSNEKGCAIG